jgi:hypothetical protein
MATLRFLHLGVNFQTGPPTPEKRGEIEKILNRAKDWFRYAPNCWLIYTGVAPKVWHERLKDGIPWITNESYLICPIDVREKSGWLRRAAWEWINQDRPG